jgi:hypothetical protein
MIEDSTLRKLLSLTASVDNEGRVWGHDTDLGSLGEILGKMREIIEGGCRSSLEAEDELWELERGDYHTYYELTLKRLDFIQLFEKWLGVEWDKGLKVKIMAKDGELCFKKKEAR